MSTAATIRPRQYRTIRERSRTRTGRVPSWCRAALWSFAFVEGALVLALLLAMHQ